MDINIAELKAKYPGAAEGHEIFLQTDVGELEDYFCVLDREPCPANGGAIELYNGESFELCGMYIDIVALIAHIDEQDTEIDELVRLWERDATTMKEHAATIERQDKIIAALTEYMDSKVATCYAPPSVAIIASHSAPTGDHARLFIEFRDKYREGFKQLCALYGISDLVKVQQGLAQRRVQQYYMEGYLPLDAVDPGDLTGDIEQLKRIIKICTQAMDLPLTEDSDVRTAILLAPQDFVKMCVEQQLLPTDHSAPDHVVGSNKVVDLNAKPLGEISKEIMAGTTEAQYEQLVTPERVTQTRAYFSPSVVTPGCDPPCGICGGEGTVPIMENGKETIAREPCPDCQPIYGSGGFRDPAAVVEAASKVQLPTDNDCQPIVTPVNISEPLCSESGENEYKPKWTCGDGDMFPTEQAAKAHAEMIGEDADSVYQCNGGK